MARYLVLKRFDGAIQGCFVKTFVDGETVEVEDMDLAGVAVAEGWVTPVDDIEGENKAAKAVFAAPKNKAAKAAPKTKEAATE